MTERLANKTPPSWHWPQDHSDFLKTLLEEQKHSYMEIAALVNAEFGSRYSKNSVLGRGCRMGFKNPDQGRLKAAASRVARQKINAMKVKKVRRALTDREAELKRDRELFSMNPKTSPAYRKYLPALPPMTKAQLREMLTQAVQNTAAMS